MEAKYKLTPRVNMRVMFRGSVYTVICKGPDNECSVVHPTATAEEIVAFLEFLKSRGVLMSFEAIAEHTPNTETSSEVTNSEVTNSETTGSETSLGTQVPSDVTTSKTEETSLQRRRKRN